MKKSNYKIPFDKEGNQLHYPDRQYRNGKYEELKWRDNFEFDDTLEIIRVQHGRSAAYFVVKSKTTGKFYTMFMKDVMDLLQGNILRAKWTFQKRGANYGIRAIKE